MKQPMMDLTPTLPVSTEAGINNAAAHEVFLQQLPVPTVPVSTHMSRLLTVGHVLAAAVVEVAAESPIIAAAELPVWLMLMVHILLRIATAGVQNPPG